MGETGGTCVPTASPSSSALPALSVLQLIKDYRDSQRIRLNAEHRLILGAAPDYDKLPLPHKCEVRTQARYVHIYAYMRVLASV